MDHIAADAYNDYTCRDDGTVSPWKPLAVDIDGVRRLGLLHPTKGVWLAEWASAVDPADSTRGPNWVDEAAALLSKPGYEQFRGVSNFNASRGGTPSRWSLGIDNSINRWAAMGKVRLHQGVARPAGGRAAGGKGQRPRATHAS